MEGSRKIAVTDPARFAGAEEGVKLSTCHFLVLLRSIPMQSFIIGVHEEFPGCACSSGTGPFERLDEAAEAGNSN